MREIFDDIKSKYQFEAPCTELTSFIEYYWESSIERSRGGGNLPFAITLFPSWTPTISFNLGSPYELSLGKDRYVLDSNCHILNFRNDVAAYRYDRNNYKFGVKFFPGTLGLLLNMDPKLFGEKLLPLQIILPGSLIEKIKSVVSFPDRVALLQDYFLACLHSMTKRKHSYYRIRNAMDVQYLKVESKNYKIAAEVFTTEKTLYRNFTSVVGATPKQYFSAHRARTALHSYKCEKSSFDPVDFGYYDWSHFYRAVFKFTGMKLTQS